MQKIWQKGCAMMLASFMVMTALAVLISTGAKADTTVANTNDRFSVDFVNAQMSAEMVYDKDPVSGDHYMLGSGDGVRDYLATTNTVRITLNLQNNWPSVTACALNITAYDAANFDFNDPDHAANSEVNSVAWTAGLPAVNTTGTHTFDFVFDILKTSGLGPTSDITLKLWYAGGGSGTSGNNVNFNIRIYISSIFANDAADEHILASPHLTDVSTGENDAFFEAGDTFADTTFALHNYDTIAINDIFAKITPPTASGVTMAGGKDVCWIPAGLAAGANVNANYRSDIASTTKPGRVTGSASINYTRADSNLRVFESGTDLNVDWPINFNFRNTDPMPVDMTYSNFQCHVSSAELVVDNGTRATPYPTVGITQPITTDEIKKFNVTIINDGNHAITNTVFRFDVTSPAWDYFRNPNIYYSESSGPLTLTDPITTLTIEDMPISGTTYFLFSAIVAKEIPIGEHRLPIIYDGFYFNDGSLGEATGFFPINGGNGIPDGADDLSMFFSVIVSDNHMDVKVTNVNVPDDDYGGDTTYTKVKVDIDNLEGYAFINVVSVGNFTGTPFYNPIVTERDTRSRLVNAEENPIADWGEYGAIDDQIALTFMVDMETDLVPDLYPFTITITAVIETTLEPVTTTIPATLVVVGYGPRIWIEAFTTTDIKAGEYFDLNLTISNDGDDTLRDAWVIIGAEGLDGWVGWARLDDFLGMVQRNSSDDGSTELTWEGSPITLEQLDIDSAKEIVALNLYIEGVYSSPSAVISLLWIDSIAPGESINVGYQMVCDKDMVNGKPYMIEVLVRGIDAEGVTKDKTMYITVMTSEKGTAYNPSETDYFMGGMQFVGIFLFIVIVIAVLFYVIRKIVFPPKKEEPRPPQ